MDIYLAADYARKHEMRDCRGIIETLGHKVVSRWIDNPDELEDIGIGGTPITDGNHTQRAQHASYDWNDIHDADMVVLFTTGNLTRGGRHTEFGMALAWGKRVVIIGPREHVFHCLPEVVHFPTRQEFVADFSRGWSY